MEQFPHLLRQAFRETTSGAPGPVHLSVIGHLGEEFETAEGNLEVTIEESFTFMPAVVEVVTDIECVAPAPWAPQT